MPMMTKKQKSELFSFGEHYKGKVDTIGFVLKDVPVGKDGKEGSAAILFLTLKLKDTVVEAQMPLSSNSDFKKHIIAIIDQAIGLKVEKEKEKKTNE
jgi:hypothetical protein